MRPPEEGLYLIVLNYLFETQTQETIDLQHADIKRNESLAISIIYSSHELKYNWLNCILFTFYSTEESTITLFPLPF